MAFKNHLCFDPALVGGIIDTEALQVPDSVFSATHHPVKMYRQDLSETVSNLRYDEDRLLADFLAPDAYIFVAVLGGAGTGKSHLIRRLATRIPRQANRRVLLIPKVGTNLRGIIKQILDSVDGNQFDEYRRRLERATVNLGERQAREELLNNLAVAVGRTAHRDEDLSEVNAYLADELPSLLYDPFFRQHLLRDEGIIHRLSAHILGQAKRVERIETRREISVADLPLSVTGITAASKQAQALFGLLLGQPELQQAVVDWMNRNLDTAIAQMLNLQGEDLLNLMTGVRQALAEQNMELVILIEDFAKLQGIDYQLLESLLVRPVQPGRPRLCGLRAAMAVTTGYFNDLKETVRQRIEFRVNLDVTLGDRQDLLTATDLISFTARYLNAVRLGRSGLETWYKEYLKDGTVPVPSACRSRECPHLEVCQEAFGEWRGISLYPFTAQALENMLRRVSPGAFNPRLLVREVIKHTLEPYGAYLAEGRFPPYGLLEHFGGARMGALQLSELQRRDPVHRARRQALLELWTDGGQIRDLHPTIHAAFSLPVLDMETPVPGPGGSPPPRPQPPTPVPQTEITPDLEAQLAVLDGWANGAELPQELAGRLREWIFPAVNNRIDWPADLMVAGFFRGVGKPFQRRGVQFARRGRASPVGRTAVQLKIPLDGQSFTDAAVALQGLLLFNSLGHWRFPKAGLYRRTYLRLLEQWAVYVRGEVDRTCTDGGVWDPVPAIVELLAVGAYMGGLCTGRDALAKRINALFQQLPAVDTHIRTPTWNRLYAHLSDSREELIRMLLARTAGTKGASADVKIIDTVRLIGPLETLGKQDLTATVPTDVRVNYRVADRIRQQVDQSLDPALDEEQQAIAAWYSRVRGFFGTHDLTEVRTKIRKAVTRAQEDGMYPQMEDFSTVDRAFRVGAVKDGMRAGARLEAGVGDRMRRLQIIGRLERRDIAESTRFMDWTESFLTRTKSRVTTDIKTFEDSTKVTDTVQKIEQGLAKITDLVTETLGGRT